MCRCGGMAEWLKAAVLKTVIRKRIVGSNPTSSASFLKGRRMDEILSALGITITQTGIQMNSNVILIGALVILVLLVFLQRKFNL